MVVHHEYNCLSFQATFQCLNSSSSKASKDQWVQQCARQATSDRPPLRLLYSSVAKLVEHTSQSNNCRVAASSRWPIIHPKLISLISDIGCLLHICYTLCFFCWTSRTSIASASSTRTCRFFFISSLGARTPSMRWRRSWIRSQGLVRCTEGPQGGLVKFRFCSFSLG